MHQIYCSIRLGKSFAPARRIRRLMRHGYLSQCLQGAAIPAPNNFPLLTRHNATLCHLALYSFHMLLVFTRLDRHAVLLRVQCVRYYGGGGYPARSARSCLFHPPPGVRTVAVSNSVCLPPSRPALKVLYQLNKPPPDTHSFAVPSAPQGLPLVMVIFSCNVPNKLYYSSQFF